MFSQSMLEIWEVNYPEDKRERLEGKKIDPKIKKIVDLRIDKWFWYEVSSRICFILLKKILKIV